jgi:hypothetical protein
MSHGNMILPAEDRRGDTALTKRDLSHASLWRMPIGIGPFWGPYWPIMSGPTPPIQEVRL